MTATISPSAPPTRPTIRQPLPKGLHWSKRWLNSAGLPVNGLPGVEVPVDDEARIAGRLWACPTGVCDHTVWTFSQDEPAPCCPKHPEVLVPAPLSADEPDPVGGARGRVAQWARDAFAQRRDRLLAAARTRLDTAEQAAADAARRTAADMRGHVPSLLSAGTVLAGGPAIVVTVGPEYAAAVGAALAVNGTVAAYVIAYLLAKLRARHRMRERGEPWNPRSRTARRIRARARHTAAGTLASGSWLMVAAASGVNPTTVSGSLTLLLGCMLAWAVNDTHWRDLWETRARLRDLARRNAEAAAERAATELAAIADQPPTPVDDSDPAEVGRRMAAEWRRVANLDTVPFGFVMARTWIVPDATREVTVPIDGQITRIGWEFTGESDPGALVGRAGTSSPLLAAQEWLAAVLDGGSHKPSAISLVDRPEGRANRFLLLITDKAPLGAPVRWKGKSGIRHASDGSIYGHRGRDLQGNDVEEEIYLPGQPTGGLVVGHIGGGKSAGQILRFLNWLSAGVFPVLFDPKQLVDYGDFVGVFPIGITTEHRDVIIESLIAERQRRERLVARKPIVDRHGRKRAGNSRWDLADGPPIGHVWEEFHDLATDNPFVGKLTNQMRFQRLAAMFTVLVTQGGGLADLNNSMLRMLLNKVALTTYRMDAHQARLAGSRHPEVVDGLPQLAGVCLLEAPSAPPLPMRDAYVTRMDEDGCVFDQLYGPNMEPLLTAPALPKPTLDLWEKTGLMDLWRRGQGPDGFDRLLADAEGAGEAPTAAQVAGTDGTPVVSASDVVLAIVHLNPGCSRATVDTSDAWMQAMAGGKVPVPSTISRAAAKLEKDGLLTRTDNRWQVTDAGREHAELMAVALLAGGPAKAEKPPTPDPVAPVVDMSEAAVERAVERQMETARLVAEQHAESGR